MSVVPVPRQVGAVPSRRVNRAAAGVAKQTFDEVDESRVRMVDVFLADPRYLWRRAGIPE